MGEVEQLCAVVDAMLVCGPLSGDDAGEVVPKRVSRDGKAAVNTVCYVLFYLPVPEPYGGQVCRLAHHET